jgi:hypothetical protein
MPVGSFQALDDIRVSFVDVWLFAHTVSYPPGEDIVK